MKIIFLGLGLSLVACTSGSNDPVASGKTCANSSDCPSDELCIEKTCQLVDCATSFDCDLEQYCNNEYECKSGCKEDTDCFAGDSCNTETKECESYGCRTSELDCGIGEFCNEMTSECYEDTRGHCTSYCSWDEAILGENTNGECANYDMGSGSCTGDFYGNQTGCTGGALCYPDDLTNSLGWIQEIPGTCITFYRFYSCDQNSQQEQCPNGFGCYGIPFQDEFGNITYTDPVCLGDCPYYLENGYIQQMFWLFACTTKSTIDLSECYNSAQCEHNAACIDGSCYEVSCRDNQGCDLQQVCQEGECVSGCQTAEDCFAGESCLEGSCQTGVPCRTPQLDCSYGEDCIDGVCQDSGFPFCQPCTFSDWQNTPNGYQECVIYTYTLEETCVWEHTQCSGDLSCYPTDQIGNTEEGFCIASYFFRSCEADSDCPRPFTCNEDIYRDGSGVNVCWADCPFWREREVF